MSGEPRPGELLLDGGALFESPRWHEHQWWVSDMFGRCVVAISPGGDVRACLPVDDRPSGIGWLPDGRMLLVLMDGRRVMALDRHRRWAVHAELGRFFDAPANDMLTDGDGRSWVGTLGFDLGAGETPAPGGLVCVEPDGRAAPAASDLLTPNGAAILADGHTLVVAETFASRLTSFTIGDGGRLGGRSVWAQLAEPPPLDDLRTALRGLRVAPDGIAVDADDCVWVADAAGGGCVRVAHGGVIVDRVDVPSGLVVLACALGGEGGTTLLLCCAPDAIERRRLARSEAVLMTTEVDVPRPL